jgi:hypothetical protein
MPKPTDSCVQPAKGPIGVAVEGSPQVETEARKERLQKMTARAGKLAPDFEASAFVDGGFQWVMLCFYPGDFTFV